MNKALKKMKLIYIAGAYRGKDSHTILMNIYNAEALGMDLVTYIDNVYPVVPHNNTRFWEGLKSPEFFIDGTLELMRRCDAVLVQTIRVETSKGTAGEIEEARRLRIPVFYSIAEVREWMSQEIE